MALRAIRINNDPILKRPCREVPQVDDRVRQLLDDMLETLHATANGAAIAAPQVGILRRLIVIDMGELSGGPLKLVNPRIIFQEGQQECEEEGCLSFPDCWLTTVRPQRVIVEAMNEEGKTILLTGSGPLAQCFSHENRPSGRRHLPAARHRQAAGKGKIPPQKETVGYGVDSAAAAAGGHAGGAAALSDWMQPGWMPSGQGSD